MHSTEEEALQLPAKTKLIVNLTSGDAVCVGELANRPLRRMKGLIGRRGLPAGEGMLLSPAPAIHTAFMRFPIDAVFLDRELRVLDIASRLQPWRVASKTGARAVLELCAGECDRRGVRIGHHLGIRDRKPVDAPVGHAPAPLISSDSVIWPNGENGADEQAREQPLRVLVISSDRHFRSVTTTLLGHRGCTVTATAKEARATELVARDDIEVVVIDVAGTTRELARTTSALEGLPLRVGVVVVREEGPSFDNARALPKWGPFDELFDEIERVERQSRSERSAR
jgi:uncharacterized protein